MRALPPCVHGFTYSPIPQALGLVLVGLESASEWMLHTGLAMPVMAPGVDIDVGALFNAGYN